MKKRFLTLALVLSLLVALIIPASVALAETGDTDVSGTLVPAAVYTFDAPTGVAFADFEAEVNYDASCLVSASSTAGGTVGITVVDSAGNAGLLKLDATNLLDTALQINADPPGYISVSDTPVAIVTGASVATPYSYDFALRQTIISADLAKDAGVYSTTLTFTATFSP